MEAVYNETLCGKHAVKKNRGEFERICHFEGRLTCTKQTNFIIEATIVKLHAKTSPFPS
jgi:hypothetical protein